MTTNQKIDGVPRELLPCPLCGSDKVSLAWDVYDTDRGRRTQSQITCLGCRLLTKTFKSHAEARAYWNNRAAQPQGEPVALDVWYGPMPETNGKTNWTAILHRKGECWSEGITIDRSEYPDRVRYEADRMLHLIGALEDEPDILAYDPDKHSGYVKAEQPTPVAAVMPERRVQPNGFTGKGWAELRGWNACLDEVKRLNP